MTETTIGRRAVLAGTAAAALTGAQSIAQTAGGALRPVPRNRTYIVASSMDGPVLTNVSNANFYNPSVDLRNGMMYATEPLFWFDFFRSELIPWLAESHAYDDGFTGLTIKVRKGADWSDGHPFTARDVAYHLQHAGRERPWKAQRCAWQRWSPIGSNKPRSWTT